MKKRILALFLVAAMAVGMLPTALAVRDERPEIPEDLVSQNIEGDVPTDRDTQTAPVVPTVVEDVPAVLAAADAAATTYDYTGTVTASAPSYQATSGDNSLIAAVDGVETTWWHTAWNGNNGGTSDLTDLSDKPNQRYIQLNLTDTIQLDGLRYLSRAMENNSDYGNGVVTQYRIEVSTDDTTYTSVSAGTWEPGASAWRIAVFPESVSAQYVRLYGVRTYGNGEGTSGSYTGTVTTDDVNKYMSAAELRLLTGVPDDWRPTNLARLDGVTADVSSYEENTHVTPSVDLDGSQAIDGVKAVPADDTTGGHPNGHWSTPQNPTKPVTLTVDLHRMCTVDMVKLFWKHDAVTAYTVQGSADGTNWTDIGSKSSRVSAAAVGELVTPAAPLENVRYIKLSVTNYDNLGTAGWANVNLWEIEIYGTAGALITPATNLARLDGVTARASGNETNTFTPEKVFDGDTSANTSRWSSQNTTTTDPAWIIVDLHRMSTVTGIDLYWQRTNVVAYKLEVSANKQDWTTVHSTTTRITQQHESFTFDTPYENVRYVRVYSDNHDDPQYNGQYVNISLYEVEIYGTATGEQIPSVGAVLESITSNEQLFMINSDGKIILNTAINVPDGFTVKIAANLEQVIGEDGTVYTPVVDKEVAIDLTVVDDSDPDETASTPAESPIRVIIPGAHTAAENEGGNPKPAVIPEIMEWSSPGDNAGYKDKSYTLTNGQVRILYRYAFAGVAKELQTDLKDLFGVEATLQRLNDTAYTTLQNVVQNGDIVLYDVNPNNSSEDTRNRVQGYDDETYGMEIYGNKVYIYATHSTGAYWGTRTLLQGLKLSGDKRSFPNGTLRDYPEFKVRGFMMDVGRKPQSLNTLYNIAKNMAWYKLNDFHLHLNDNLIWMEDYCTRSDRSDYQSAYEAYSAFRMESNIQEEPGAKPLTAKDYAYTKKDFKQFIADAATLGVNIIPEFDVPAHAKAITDAFPSLRLNKTGTFRDTTRPWIDHLDLTNKMDESLAKVQEIFGEYIAGDDPVFSGKIVHFGADEYYDDYAAYAPFAKGMVDYIQSQGKTVRMWGSLTMMGDSNHLFTKEVAQSIQMNIWSTGWASPQSMYDLGFNLINITDAPFYMVPSGSCTRNDSGYGYGDYLNLDDLYNKAPNQFGSSSWFPASSSQVLGESVGMWMDNIDTHASGLDEVDAFQRFLDAIPVASVRQWGVENKRPARTLTELQADAAIIGTAPGTNPYYKAGVTDSFAYNFADNTDQSGNGHDLTLTNAEVNSSKSLLVLKGGESYAETGLDRLGWDNQLSFRALKLTASDEEEILFEADHAYGDYAIKALPVEGDATKWKLGFSRELYDYEFNVELPVGKWVKLTLTTAKQSTKLSVDGGAAVAAVGKFVSKPDSNTQFKGKTGITNSSFELPVARIGSKTNAFKGYIAAVTTGEPIEVPDAFITATAPSEMKSPAGTDVIEGPASYAVDGDLSTMWHSNWGTNRDDNPNDLSGKPDLRYIQLNLLAPVTVSGLSYTPRSGGGTGTVTQYRIEVSTDGENFTSVATGDWQRDGTEKTATFAPQQNVIAVRLYGVTTYSAAADDPANKFMSALEVGLTYGPITLTEANTAIAVGDVTWGETAATAEITVALKPSGFVLTEDTDYTVLYSDNTEEGTATATITGVGGYTGFITATFEVPAKPAVVDISTATVTFAQTSYPLENGKAEPDPTVKVGNTTLLRGLDYTVTYANNTRVGTATATITGIGEYTGQTAAEFTVVPAIVKKNLSNTAKTKLTLSQTTFPYEGAAIEPEVVVTYEGETLTKGKDYTVSYARNNAIGTATVTVTGVAPYCEGKASATFTIVSPAKGNDLSDVNKTKVTLRPTEYAYTGKPIVPTSITVTYNEIRLRRDVDFTVELNHNVEGGTGVLIIHGIGDYYGSFVTTFTIIGGGSGSGSGNTGNTPGGNTGSSGGTTVVSSTATEIEKRDDGTTITTITDRQTGTVVTEAKYADGSTVTSAITAKGEITASVTLPKNADEATVVIPTKQEPNLGQVAVIMHPDGTEEIVKNSQATEDGMQLTLTEDAQIKVVDNTKEFVDVSENHWAKDAITYVTSREIFNGTGSGTFTPNGAMSRAMVCTVLANLEGVDTSGGQVWYEKAVEWAKGQKVSDGANPGAIVSREQLVTMLYRYAGSPATSGNLGSFTDVGKVSNWAAIPMAWAIQNGLITGRDNGELDPATGASRAEVALIFQRYLSMKK